MFLSLNRHLLFFFTALVPFTIAESYDPMLFVAGGTSEDTYKVAKYVISIQRSAYIKKYFGYFHTCGGSIIGKNKILTAAHCITDFNGKKVPARELVVVVGLRNRFKSTSQTRVMHPSHVIPHKGYNLIENTNTAYDIGLIILKKDIELDGDMIAQIALPSAPVEANKPCTVVGWGRVFHNGPVPAEISFALVTIFTTAECKEMNGYAHASTLICAGDRVKWQTDACQGDSGGPLVCDDKVVGIVSAGFQCAGPRLPGMYTDVYQFLKWIENRGYAAVGQSNIFILFIIVKTVVGI